MADSKITEDQCKKVLKKWNKNASLLSFSLSPLNNQLDGLIGEQLFLTITYQEGNTTDSIRFFVKILPQTNPLTYQLCREALVCEKENFFYNQFVPALQSYNLNCDYVPKSYLCESLTVVLEDLTQSGYKGTKKNGFLNSDHCYLCLKTLARFHADGIIYELLRSKEFSTEYHLNDEFPDVLEETMFNKNSAIMKYYVHSIEGLLRIYKLLPENGIMIEDFTESLLKAVEDLRNFKQTKQNFRLTLTHSDLWGNNLLYKYDEHDKVESCKIIDFQTVNMRPPAFDVLIFLMLNIEKKERDKHLNEFLKYYHKYLSKYIKEKDFDSNEVLSEMEFFSSCDVLMLPAKIHSVVDRSITITPEETFLNASATEESFRDFLFEGRPKYMVEAFTTNHTYREILTEDIAELRSLLFKQ